MKQGVEEEGPGKMWRPDWGKRNGCLLISGLHISAHAAALPFLWGDDSWGTEQIENNLASKNKKIQSHAP